MARSPGIQDRYDALVVQMKRRYALRINKWRKSMSGCAWTVHYRDGSVSRLIESPYPRGPMSAAIFLHEVGHHAIGLRTFSPRCLEEFKAWQWALDAMTEHGINVTDSVRRRMHESLHYAVEKARRRGLKKLPVELAPYVHPLPGKPIHQAAPSPAPVLTRRAATSMPPKSRSKHAKHGWRDIMRQLWLWNQ